jgi:hypothetical protein
MQENAPQLETDDEKQAPETTVSLNTAITNPRKKGVQLTVEEQRRAIALTRANEC